MRLIFDIINGEVVVGDHLIINGKDDVVETLEQAIEVLGRNEFAQGTEFLYQGKTVARVVEGKVIAVEGDVPTGRRRSGLAEALITAFLAAANKTMSMGDLMVELRCDEKQVRAAIDRARAKGCVFQRTAMRVWKLTN